MPKNTFGVRFVIKSSKQMFRATKMFEHSLPIGTINFDEQVREHKS